jgi:hypothetical protein
LIGLSSFPAAARGCAATSQALFRIIICQPCIHAYLMLISITGLLLLYSMPFVGGIS